MKKKYYAMLLVAVFCVSMIGMGNSQVSAQNNSVYELDFWYTPTHYGQDEDSVAQLIKAQLDGTGYFDVNIKSTEWSQYTSQLGSMGAFLLGWWFDYPDPSNYIDPFAGSGAFSLGTNYSSSVMDGHIDTMLTETDPTARKNAQIAAQNLLAEDVPVVPLFSMLKQFSGYQDYISGYNLEPSENVHYNTIVDSSANPNVVIGTTDSIPNLDPADAYNYFASNTLVQITHGLMEMPKNGTTAELGPIAESYTVSSDAQQYNFTLKQGISFSDGTAFNATAMKWNLDRAMSLDGNPGFLLSDVVKNVTVPEAEPYKLVINLQSPDATFLQRLTYTVAWPISPNSLSNDTIQGSPENIPAGLGPYEVTSWSDGTELILEPNPTYFGTAPANSQVTIQFFTDASALLTALENGEIDIAQKQFGPDEISSIKASSSLKWTEKATAGIRYIVLNVEEHTDKRVRQAIAAAVDRAEITSTVFQDLNAPLYSMVPTIFDSHVDAFSDGTQAEVAELMEAAGYTGGGAGDGDQGLPFLTLPMMLSLFTTLIVVRKFKKD